MRNLTLRPMSSVRRGALVEVLCPRRCAVERPSCCRSYTNTSQYQRCGGTTIHPRTSIGLYPFQYFQISILERLSTGKWSSLNQSAIITVPASLRCYKTRGNGRVTKNEGSFELFVLYRNSRHFVASVHVKLLRWAT